MVQNEKNDGFEFAAAMPGYINVSVNYNAFSKIANELFTNDNAIFEEFRLDLRSELAISTELTRQAIPVFINQFIIGIYLTAVFHVFNNVPM